MLKTAYQKVLNKERRSNSLLTILVCLAALTGFSTYFLGVTPILQQWVWLLHALVGLILAVQLAPYLIFHVERTLAFRRWLLISSGFLMVLAVLTLVFTGGVLIFVGQSETTPWLLEIHLIGAFSFVAFLIGHVALHAITFPRSRKQLKGSIYASFEKGLVKKVLASFVIVGTLVITLGLIVNGLEEPYSTGPVVADYEKTYGSHPFRPSQTETWHGKFVDYRQIAVSEDCSGCHKAIAEEWSSSIHRHAASDKAYVTNISLLAEKRGLPATRYCEGCHAPVALLTGQLSAGGDHGGITGTLANIEGVGCMGCHGIKRVVHLKGVASYEFEPQQDYLFGGFDNLILTSLRHMLIRFRPEQHKADLGRPVLSSSTLCATCHAQFMDKDLNNWGWVKMQDDYEAWLESPFSSQNQQTFANSEVKRCQDCHMPLVVGEDPSANENGKYRSHRFLGANTVVPLLTGDDTQLFETKAFLQKNKMRISIEEPRRVNPTRSQQIIDENLRTDSQTPYYLYIGEEAEINTIVSNIGVGHNFPAGTLDINEAWVAFSVIDASSQLVYQSGYLQDDNTVDPDAHFYRSQPIDRAGNLVWKHDLFNRVGEAYKDFVPAGKSDILTYKFRVPDWAKGPLTISTTLKYRKLNERYSRWALKEQYQPIPIIDVARNSIAVPLKVRPEVGRL